MPNLLGFSEVGIWGDIQEPFPVTMGAGEPLFSPSPVGSMWGTGSPDLATSLLGDQCHGSCPD